MKTTIEFEIKPFTVPNFVIPVLPPVERQGGFMPTEGIPLSSINENDLWRMCEEFTNSVFKKAGKIQPQWKVDL